jgi:hypothetical protein
MTIMTTTTKITKDKQDKKLIVSQVAAESIEARLLRRQHPRISNEDIKRRILRDASLTFERLLIEKSWPHWLIKVVSMMVQIVQTAHASCITNKGNIACSGGGCSFPGANSCSTSNTIKAFGDAGSGPSGSSSVSSTFNGLHTSTLHNFKGRGNCADNTCSGK